MKKLIILLLSSCFLLSSCSLLTLKYTLTGDTTSKLSDGAPVTSYTEITPQTPVTLPELDKSYDAEKLLSTLPQMNFAEKYFGQNSDGAVAYFVIATIDDAPVFASADEISGSSVASALNAVEERHNLDIINMPFAPDEFDAKIKESQQSGVYFADLLSLPAQTAKTYATAEYCKPLATLPFVSSDAPYFVNDLSKYGGEFAKFAVMSEASYLTKDLCCLYFDASVVGNEIYTKALDSTLDWTYVRSLMDQTGRGINSTVDLEDLFRLTSGARYALEDGKSVLKTSPFITTEQTYEAEIALLNQKLETLLAYKNTEDPLFIVDTIGNYENYTSKSTRYGILPLPSAEDGKTYGYVSPEKVNYFLCPNYTTTNDGAGLMLSVLGAASSQREANVILNLVRDNARDNGTLLVSHLLFTAPAWDIEY